MVRINLINPKNLTDQHLVAEYSEILILLGQLRKFPKPKNIPQNYCLGKGHINFFKNKLIYLKKRHEQLKKEMKIRGFKPIKTIELKHFDRNLKNNWKPCKIDKKIIKKRLIQRINQKPKFYRYHGKHKPKKFLIELVKKAG